MYKIIDISVETWNKAEVSVIRVHENDNVNKTLLKLLCTSDVKKRWGGKNPYDLIEKEIKGKYEIRNMNNLTKKQIRKYKIARARWFRIQSNQFDTKKRRISDRINNRHIQRRRYTNSMYCFRLQDWSLFYEYKLVIEIVEIGHNDKNTDYEIKRQREIEKEFNCVFIRTNPDAADLNINKLNNQIFKHIIQLKEEKLKNKFAKELLSLAFLYH